MWPKHFSSWFSTVDPNAFGVIDNNDGFGLNDGCVRTNGFSTAKIDAIINSNWNLIRSESGKLELLNDLNTENYENHWRLISPYEREQHELKTVSRVSVWMAFQ